MDCGTSYQRVCRPGVTSTCSTTLVRSHASVPDRRYKYERTYVSTWSEVCHGAWVTVALKTWNGLLNAISMVQRMYSTNRTCQMRHRTRRPQKVDPSRSVTCITPSNKGAPRQTDRRVSLPAARTLARTFLACRVGCRCIGHRHARSSNPARSSRLPCQKMTEIPFHLIYLTFMLCS